MGTYVWRIYESGGGSPYPNFRHIHRTTFLMKKCSHSLSRRYLYFGGDVPPLYHLTYTIELKASSIEGLRGTHKLPTPINNNNLLEVEKTLPSWHYVEICVWRPEHEFYKVSIFLINTEKWPKTRKWKPSQLYTES